MHSLRAKILITAFALLFCFSGGFIFYSRKTAENYKKLRLYAIERTIALEKEKMNKMISSIEHSAVSLAMEGLLYYRAGSLNMGQGAVEENLPSFPSVLGGGFWFEPYAYNQNLKHAVFYVYHDTGSGKMKRDYSFSAGDYHETEWYRQIAENLTMPYQVVWTKPYFDERLSRGIITTAGAGIFNSEGSLVGISTVDCEIDDMLAVISELKITENTFVVLHDPFYDCTIIDTRTGFAGESDYAVFEYSLDNGWTSVIYVPEHEIFADIDLGNMRLTVGLAVAMIVILLAGYITVSILVYNPIMRIISDVVQIAKGNLDVRTKSSSKDEFGTLSEAINEMASALKVLIENAAKERAEKDRITAEFGFAAQIQKGMLPGAFPVFPEFNISAAMFPAREIGGDFYDYFMVEENKLAVIIADVSGKGIPAALFMVIAKILIKNNVYSGKSPGDVLEMVNEIRCEKNDAGMFVTAFIGCYNMDNGHFVYANAGHNPPMVKRNGGDYEYIKIKPNFVLGCMENVKYQEEEMIIRSGDSIFLYTDGITEAVNGDQEFFGEERLFDIVKNYKHCPPDALLSGLKTELDHFSRGEEQSDDITMLALEVNEIMKNLSVEASIDKLDEVIDFIEAELANLDCPGLIKSQITVAAEEIFVNIANYSYKPESGYVDIGIAAGKELLLRFEDSGAPYNPLEQADPDLGGPLMERAIGGLGVFLFKKIMDRVSYSRVQGRNILAVRKMLAG